MLGGRDITRLEPRHRDMGLVFQNYALFPHKTVFDNVALRPAHAQDAARGDRRRVHRMLELVGLPGVEDAPARISSAVGSGSASRSPARS